MSLVFFFNIMLLSTIRKIVVLHLIMSFTRGCIVPCFVEIDSMVLKLIFKSVHDHCIHTIYYYFPSKKGVTLHINKVDFCFVLRLVKICPT